MPDNVIGTKLELTGEKEFNRQMTEVNNTLKTSRSDLSVLSAQYADNAKSADAYRAKQDALNSIAEQSRAKTQALREQYEKAAAAYGETSAKAQKYKQQLNAAIVAEIKATKAADDNAEALVRLSKANSVLDAAISGGIKAIKALGSAAGTSAKNVTKLSVTAAGAGAKNLLKFTGAAAGAAAAITAALGGAALAGLTAMTSFANEAAAAAKTAAEAGQPLSETQKKWLAYSDSLEALNTASASAKAAIGGLLLPALNDLSQTGAKFLGDFAADLEAAGTDTQKQSQVIAKYIASGAALIKEQLPQYAEFAKGLITGIGSGVAEAGPELLDIGTDILLDILDGIIGAAPKIADGGIAVVEKLLTALISRGPELVTSGAQLVTSILTGLASAAPKLLPMAAELIKNLAVSLIRAAPELVSAGGDLLKSLAQGLLSALSLLGDAADEIIEAVREAFGDKAAEYATIGFELVKSVFSGISNASSWIHGKLSDWVSALIKKIKGMFDDRDPDSSGGSGASGGSVGASGFSASGSAPFGGLRPQSQSSVILNIQAQTITQTDMDMIVDTVNRRLGT